MYYDIYRRDNNYDTYERMADPEAPGDYTYEDDDSAQEEAATLRTIDPTTEYAVVPVALPVGSDAWEMVKNTLIAQLSLVCADLFEGGAYECDVLLEMREEIKKSLGLMGVEESELESIIRKDTANEDYVAMLTLPCEAEPFIFVEGLD